ncbi:MAG: tetratricopeptide repeat protein [Planctomycetota bacterium]
MTTQNEKKRGGRKTMRSAPAVKTPRKSVANKVTSISSAIHSAARRPDIHPLDRAINELRGELAKKPDDPTVLSRLGALYYRRGDLPEAERFLRKAIAVNPRRPNYHNNLGNVLCDMGKMKDGIVEYESAIAIEKADNPEKVPSLEASTNLELAKTEYRLIHERIEYLERALELDVGAAEELNALGCGYLLRGDRVKAIAHFRRAAEADPRSLQAGLNIAFAHTLDLHAENINDAVAETAEYIARFQGTGRLYIHWAELLESCGLLDEAEERYTQAIKHDPRCIEAYDLLGRLRLGQGTLGSQDDAWRAAQTAIKNLENGAAKTSMKLPDAPTAAQSLYDTGLAAVARARFFRKPLAEWKAVDAVLRAAAQEGQLPMNATNLAILNVAAKASLLRAQLLENDGKRDEAMVVLDNIPLTDEMTAKVWFERGALALRSGEIDKALKSFDKATLANPRDAVAYHSLRFALDGYRRYWTEKIRFETSAKNNPNDAIAHFNYATALYSVLKDSEALTYFEKALSLDEHLADAACGMGKVFQRQGHGKEAEAAFVKALKIEPTNAEAKRLLDSLRVQKMGAK